MDEASSLLWYYNREDASSIITAGATANATEGNSRASRESELLVLIHTGDLRVAWGIQFNCPLRVTRSKIPISKSRLELATPVEIAANPGQNR